MHIYLHKKYKYLRNDAQMGCTTEKDAFNLGVISLRFRKKLLLVNHRKTSKFDNNLYIT
jgi:hypothetical protein